MTDTVELGEMPRGFPRPRIDIKEYATLPLPYVAAGPDAPGVLDYERSTAAWRDFLCQVCGLEVTDDVCGVATGAAPDENWIHDDNGLTHLGCARITARMCPEFVGQDPTMLMWTVTTAELRAHWGDAARIPLSAVPSAGILSVETT